MPTTKPPVEIVEVATVDVALKEPKVGVEVAVTTPELLVESNTLAGMPDRVVVPETVRDVRVPSDVREDKTTLEARVVPVRSPAAAAAGTPMHTPPMEKQPLVMLMPFADELNVEVAVG